jgi:hypothetical protein
LFLIKRLCRTATVKTRESQEGDRDLIYTERAEHSNKGHYFDFMKDISEEYRLAVIAFLKTF